MKLNKISLRDLPQGTNVIDLEVPPELEKTIKCGVSFIDSAMGGEGFTPSSCMLFTGSPGAGKTTAMLQMADSITKSGNVCLFNTAEESPLQIRKAVKRLGLKHGFFIGQDTSVHSIIKHAKFLMKHNKGKQVFVICDSLACLDDEYYENGHTNSMTAVRSTEVLADFAKETYSIVVIIGHVTKDKSTFAGKQQIKHTVDIHCHLYIDDAKKSETYGLRLFEVQKNRFGGSGRVHILDMAKEGLSEIGSFDMIDKGDVLK